MMTTHSSQALSPNIPNFQPSSFPKWIAALDFAPEETGIVVLDYTTKRIVIEKRATTSVNLKGEMYGKYSEANCVEMVYEFFANHLWIWRNCLLVGCEKALSKQRRWQSNKGFEERRCVVAENILKSLFYFYHMAFHGPYFHVVDPKVWKRHNQIEIGNHTPGMDPYDENKLRAIERYKQIFGEAEYARIKSTHSKSDDIYDANLIGVYLYDNMQAIIENCKIYNHREVVMIDELGHVRPITETEQRTLPTHVSLSGRVREIFGASTFIPPENKINDIRKLVLKGKNVYTLGKREFKRIQTSKDKIAKEAEKERKRKEKEEKKLKKEQEKVAKEKAKNEKLQAKLKELKAPKKRKTPSPASSNLDILSAVVEIVEPKKKRMTALPIYPPQMNPGNLDHLFATSPAYLQARAAASKTPFHS